jgi:hypothetical protein
VFGGLGRAEVHNGMTGATKIVGVTWLFVAVSASTGCAYNNYLSYGPGRIEYTGARIEYLDAAR